MPLPALTEKDFHLRYIKMQDGCWIWQGPQMGPGYGCWKRHTYAHRYSYELFIGPVPEGNYVLHSCDTRLCVNPKHLFLGTQRDNIHDMIGKGRHGNRFTGKVT